jgi:cobalt-zinc-cadmium resistance protein CzcA
MKMARPAAFGQLIILLVFAPILTLEGVEGKTFHPMAATFMLALVGAFIFSFTFVPAMAALLVREPKVKDGDAHADDGEHETADPRAACAHRPVVRKAVAHPRTVLAGAVMVVVGIGSFSLLGREFMPTLDEGNVAMQALRVPSTSLEQSLAMQLALEKAIAKQPEVETVFSRTGTAEAAIDPMPTNISDNVIVLKPRRTGPIEAGQGRTGGALREAGRAAAGQQLRVQPADRAALQRADFRRAYRPGGDDLRR